MASLLLFTTSDAVSVQCWTLPSSPRHGFHQNLPQLFNTMVFNLVFLNYHQGFHCVFHQLSSPFSLIRARVFISFLCFIFDKSNHSFHRNAFVHYCHQVLNNLFDFVFTFWSSSPVSIRVFIRFSVKFLYDFSLLKFLSDFLSMFSSDCLSKFSLVSPGFSFTLLHKT